MKALVLEIRDGTAAVLREDGTVVKVKRRCEVGQTIVVEDQADKLLDFSNRTVRILAAAVAAALVLLVGGGVFSLQNLTAYSYMSLDVNPSLEYTLNRGNRVIGVRALNDDALEIVENVKKAGIRNASVAKTLQETATVLSAANYLTDANDDYMLVGVTSRDEKHMALIEDEIKAAAESELKDSVSVCTVSTTLEERKKAQSLGVSAGRYGTMKEVVAKNNGNIDELSEAEMNEMSGSVKDLLTSSEKIAKAPSPAAAQAPAPQTPAAPTSVSAPVVAQTPPQNTEEEPEEEKKESKSSKKKKKEKTTVSGDEAGKKEEGEAAASETASEEVSGNSSGGSRKRKAASTSDNTASESSSGSGDSGSQTGSEPVAIAPVPTPAPAAAAPAAPAVPTQEQIGSPQDLTVGEYQAKYNDLINNGSQGTPAETPGDASSDTGEGKTEKSGSNSSQSQGGASEAGEAEGSSTQSTAPEQSANPASVMAAESEGTE